MPVRRDRRRYGADALDTRRGGHGDQASYTPPAIKEIDFWLRLNGADVSNTNSVQAMTDTDEREVITLSHTIELESGDYIQLMFAVNDLNIMLNAFAADAVGPATPSVSAHITKLR